MHDVTVYNISKAHRQKIKFPPHCISGLNLPPFRVRILVSFINLNIDFFYTMPMHTFVPLFFIITTTRSHRRRHLILFLLHHHLIKYYRERTRERQRESRINCVCPLLPQACTCIHIHSKTITVWLLLLL